MVFFPSLHILQGGYFIYLLKSNCESYWNCFALLFSINNYFLFHTCLGGGTGFLILRKSAPEADRLCRCDLEEWLWPPGTPFPDSSDNESRLSVDWPLTIRLGPMRFSGEDSSAKLCRGGEVSELPPDFGPTVNKPIGLFPICYSKNSFNFVLFLHYYTINQHILLPQKSDSKTS